MPRVSIPSHLIDVRDSSSRVYHSLMVLERPERVSLKQLGDSYQTHSGIHYTTYAVIVDGHERYRFSVTHENRYLQDIKITVTDNEFYKAVYDMHGNLLEEEISLKPNKVQNPLLKYEVPKLDTVKYSASDVTFATQLVENYNRSRGKDTVMGKLDELKMLEAKQAVRLREEARIAELQAWKDSLPEEPDVDAVVSFERVFEDNGRRYSFVAYQAVEGKWYLSQDGVRGARKPAMSWFELLDFVGDEPMWIAASWEQLK